MSTILSHGSHTHTLFSYSIQFRFSSQSSPVQLISLCLTISYLLRKGERRSKTRGRHVDRTQLRTSTHTHAHMQCSRVKGYSKSNRSDGCDPPFAKMPYTCLDTRYHHRISPFELISQIKNIFKMPYSITFLCTQSVSLFVDHHYH